MQRRVPQDCIAGSGGEADPEDVGLLIFRTPLAAFDVLLVLRPEALPQVSSKSVSKPQSANMCARHAPYRAALQGCSESACHLRCISTIMMCTCTTPACGHAIT